MTFITYFGRVGETGDKSRQLTHGATMFLPRRMVRLRRCAAALQKLHPGLVQQEGSRLLSYFDHVFSHVSQRPLN